MPRIFKGTETLLKLFVPRVDEGNLETLKIGLFTDDTNNATEFYGDNMSFDGDTVYLKVNAWSFDKMNDGVLNYIAEIEIGEEIIITERQSNYFLKTPNQYVPVGPDVDLSDYYTKSEIDEMLEDIEVDVDLTGYATEQWVRQQGYVTDSDVNDYVGNEIGQLEEIINTKQDNLISGTNIKTINGNDILGEGDITIEGGDLILPTDSITCNSVTTNSINTVNINANSAEFDYATFNGEIYLNGGGGMSPMVDTANGITTAYKTSRTMVNDTWVDNIHIGNRYDGNNRINFTTTNYNVPEIGGDNEKIVASIDADGNFYEGETKLSDKYAVQANVNQQLMYKQNLLSSGMNIKTINGESLLGGGDITIEGGGENDCIVIQYVGDYTVDYDGEEVEYNYEGSERQSQNVDAIQKILNGEAKAVYYQYLHEQEYRTDEDGYNNKPTWLMMPMVYRYPSHDNIARFMGVINKDEWGSTDSLYAVGIMLNESDASIYMYKESQIETGSDDSSTSDGGSSSSGAVVIEVPFNMGLSNDMAKTIFDNMGNVAIAVKPFFGTVDTKYNVTHCVYRETPSTVLSTVVTAMNGTELYQWTITDTSEQFAPTKKTLTFA